MFIGTETGVGEGVLRNVAGGRVGAWMSVVTVANAQIRTKSNHENEKINDVHRASLL